MSAPSETPQAQAIPRRVRLDLITPAERAIYDAVQAVEALVADVRLTDAVILLGAARESVADFVDGIDKRRYVSEQARYRVQVEERYGAVAQWQAEAETNRQAWLKAEAALAASEAGRRREGCINCGEQNDGGYMSGQEGHVDEGAVGPFCSVCWQLLRENAEGALHCPHCECVCIDCSSCWQADGV